MRKNNHTKGFIRRDSKPNGTEHNTSAGCLHWTEKGVTGTTDLAISEVLRALGNRCALETQGTLWGQEVLWRDPIILGVIKGELASHKSEGQSKTTAAM